MRPHKRNKGNDAGTDRIIKRERRKNVFCVLGLLIDIKRAGSTCDGILPVQSSPDPLEAILTTNLLSAEYHRRWSTAATGE